MKEFFIYDWFELKNRPLNFGGLFIGLLMSFLLFFISYNLFRYLPTFIIPLIIFLLLLSLWAVVYIKLSKTTYGAWVMVLVLGLQGSFNGYNISEFMRLDQGEQLYYVSVEKSLQSENPVVIQFINHQFLRDKALIDLWQYRGRGGANNEDVSTKKVFVPIVDNNWKEGDEVHYLLTIEEYSNVSLRVPSSKLLLDKLEYHYKKTLKLIDDNGLREDLETYTDKKFRLAKNFRLLNIIENEMYVLSGKIEQYNSIYAYLMLTVIFFVFGIPTIIGTRDKFGGSWWWHKE